MKSFKSVFVIFSFLFSIGLFAQNPGLSWIQILSSKGKIHSHGFLVDSSASIYHAVTFDQPIFIPEIGDTIFNHGLADGLILKMNRYGQMVDIWHFSNNGHLSITDFIFRNQNIVICGSFQDSLFIINGNGKQFLLSSSMPLSAFIIEISRFGEVIIANQPYPNLKYASINKIHFSSSNFIKAMFASDSTSKLIQNIIEVEKQNQNLLFPLLSTTKHSLLGIIEYKNNICFYGSFIDSLSLVNTSISSKAGRDAYVGFINSDNHSVTLKSFNSHQNAEVVDAAVYNDQLWLAINYSDSLFLPNGDTLVSFGGTETLLAAFNDSLILVHQIQLKGILSERTDKLYVQDSIMYLFTNISSPVIEAHVNGCLVSTFRQDNIKGNAALFAISKERNPELIWMTQHDWTTKITGLWRPSLNETIISGSFTDKLTIDSTIYLSNGFGDAFLFRIYDDCINKFKSTTQFLYVCNGDSLMLSHVGITPDGYAFVDTGIKDNLYISKDISLSFRHLLDCGCLATDTVVIVFTDNDLYSPQNFSNQNSIFLSNSKKVIPIKHTGSCIKQDLSVRIFPNPFQHFTTIEFWSPNNVSLTYSIQSVNGKILRHENNLSFASGLNRFNPDSRGLSSGIYFLIVVMKIGEHIYQHQFKLIKQ